MDNINALPIEHKLYGDISKLVFSSDDSDYSVIKILTPEGAERTAVGNFSGAFEGQSIEMTGYWEKHKEHGQQFRAKTFKFSLPKTPDGIKKYLSSGLIPGIGPKFAERIVEKFGTMTIGILDNYSARLNEIPGIGRKRIEMIKKAWHENSAKRELYIFLQSLGISMCYAQKIYRFYGERTPAVIKENPYRLADDIHGIGFIMSDRIASNLGIGKTNIFRLSSGAVYGLRRLAEQQGHVCYPQEDFIKLLCELLGVEEAEAKRGIENAVERGYISIADGSAAAVKMLYLSSLYHAEKECAAAIKRICSAQNHRGRKISGIVSGSGISFNREQTDAVENVSMSPLSVITGGPGVGKTTVISEIVRRAKIAKLRIYLCAPTGRAAKRMSEACRFAAMTIHRLLKWEPERKSFVYNDKRPLNCDILVVDEVSMLDIQLAYYLFRAVASGTSVVLVGDADQLPSVGPGNFLSDLIKSGKAKTTHLKEIYRQASGSGIIFNAHLVNSGKMPDTTPVPREKKSDFYWVDSNSPEDASDLIVRLASSRIPKRFGMDPLRDIQILSPMNKGICGAIALNKKLQETLNPDNHKKPQFRFGETVFRAGDRVMQTSNNYDKSVFNGDMGRIYHINYEDKKFTVEYDGVHVEYDFLEADQLVHCYATTVHKAQGSEFPAVIVPVLTQHFIMLRRNLLYTAITRAKKLLVLIGYKKALSIAVKNFRVETRNSLLSERLIV
jgi:exodeoxyribonuclease V alpha subunit